MHTFHFDKWQWCLWECELFSRHYRLCWHAGPQLPQNGTALYEDLTRLFVHGWMNHPSLELQQQRQMKYVDAFRCRRVRYGPTCGLLLLLWHIQMHIHHLLWLLPAKKKKGEKKTSMVRNYFLLTRNGSDQLNLWNPELYNHWNGVFSKGSEYTYWTSLVMGK